MIQGDWREKTLHELDLLFKDNPDVISLSLFGSTSKPDVQVDRWSDHDVLVIVKDGALGKFYPTREWLKPFGDIFAIQQNEDEIHCNIKVIFSDFKKIDFVLTTESKAKNELKYLTKQMVIFSKDHSITELLQEAPLSLPNNTVYDFDKLIQDYWYWSFVAVTKLIRNDLLISLHLTLDLYRKCLELGMWLRDRETGTNVHRTGGVRNDLIEKMNIELQGSSKKDILELIEKCGKEFDKLALEWDSNYEIHFSTFEKMLSLAKEDI